MTTQVSEPGHWPSVPLRSLLASMESGSRPKGGVRNIGYGVPSIGGEHLTPDGGFSFANVRFVPESFFKGMRRGHIRRNDVLIVKDGATTGKVSMVSDDFPFDRAVVNEHVFVCRPAGVDPAYLFWYLHSAEGQRRILEHFRGSAQGGITQDFADHTMIPLPSPAEQERISALMNELHAERRAILGHLARAQRELLRFRQALLFQAYEDAAQDSDDLVRLDSILDEPLKNGYSARPVPRTTSTRVLTLTATTSGYFDGSHFKFTDESFPTNSPYWVRPGDILVQRGNTAEFVGVPAIYEGDACQFLFPDLMIRVRVAPPIGPRYVWYMLLAPQSRSYVRDRATGAAGNMPKINHSVLESVPVPMPDEQTRTSIEKRLDVALAAASLVSGQLASCEHSVGRASDAVVSACFHPRASKASRVIKGTSPIEPLRVAPVLEDAYDR